MKRNVIVLVDSKEEADSIGDYLEKAVLSVDVVVNTEHREFMHWVRKSSAPIVISTRLVFSESEIPFLLPRAVKMVSPQALFLLYSTLRMDEQPGVDLLIPKPYGLQPNHDLLAEIISFVKHDTTLDHLEARFVETERVDAVAVFAGSWM